MCGRYVTPEEAEIERAWHIGRHNWRSPFAGIRLARYNVAPGQGNPANYVPVIRADPDGTLELCDMQWWLLPFWSKEPKIRFSTFNARVEGIATSASFREPFKRRRCLIPARGWYEWQVLSSGKQPWYFHSADGALLAFAGLWDRWERDGVVIESCAMIVGESNGAVRAVHNRMPLTIPLEQQSAWVDPGMTDLEGISALLRPWVDGAISCHSVSKRVGNVTNDGPNLIEPEWPQRSVR